MTPTRRGFLAGSAAAALGAFLPSSLMAATASSNAVSPEEWRSIWAAPADELDLDGFHRAMWATAVLMAAGGVVSWLGIRNPVAPKVE